MEIESAAE